MGITFTGGIKAPQGTGFIVSPFDKAEFPNGPTVSLNPDDHIDNVEYITKFEGNIDNLHGTATASLLDNATISSTDTKYGTGSMDLTSGHGMIHVTGFTDTFLNGNFTMEGWFKTLGDYGPYGYHELLYMESSAGFVKLSSYNNGGNQRFYMQSLNGSGGSFTVYGSGAQYAIPTGWVHVALTREGNVFRGFANGLLQATYTAPITFGSGVNLRCGNKTPDSSNAAGLNGYVDELRVTQGVARYTGTFTPPTEF